MCTTEQAVKLNPVRAEFPPKPVAAAAPHRLAVIAAFAATYVIWGSTYLAIRYAVETIPPLYAASSRHLVAGSILLVWCLAKRLRPTWEQFRASMVIGFLFFLLGHGSLHWAETRVPTGEASLLIACEPIFVFLIASLAARKWRVNVSLLAGAFLGLAAVALLMGRSLLASAPGMALGGFAILFGAAAWSTGIVYSRRSKLSGSPLLLSALSLLCGSMMLGIAGTVFGEYRGFSLASVAARSWWALAYLVVFGSVITFTAYNWLLDHFSPTLVSTHTYVNPLIAVLLGWRLAGEKVTWTEVLATAGIIAAVMLVDRGTKQLRRASDVPAEI